METFKNYTKASIGHEARTELIALSGTEISINNLPAPISPINEEFYAVLSGKCRAVIDGETLELSKGDWLNVIPTAKRQFFAADDSPLEYICIQVKENSLGTFTADDAVIE